MKQYTITKTVYNFDELTDDAKENARQWYLADETRGEYLYHDMKDRLEYIFPKSGNLDVSYSLAYCQGDHLEITGEIWLYSMVEKFDYTDKEKRALYFYIDRAGVPSAEICDFRNTKYTNDPALYVECDFLEWLQFHETRDINERILHRFFADIAELIEKTETELKEDGYRFLYDVDEEEISETAAANGWYFDFDGYFAGCF